MQPTCTDRTLASNWFTALVPRPDRIVTHGTRYYLEGVGARGREIIARWCGRKASAQVAPGSVPSSSAAGAGAGAAPSATLRCAETGRAHPVLPPGMVDEVRVCARAIGIACAPGGRTSWLGPHGHGLRDAFAATAAIATPQDTLAQVPLLPDAVRCSTLVNRGLRLGGESLAGEVSDTYPTTLFDPKTGMAASITVRGAQVLIAFGPMGSQGGTLAQAIRCGLNILGLWPPKSFSQADKLTRLVKAHLEDLNAKGLEGQPPYTLKLTGHSMGGGLATYAALRNGVPALVIAPMHLGLTARAVVGHERIAQAGRWVREVVVQGDWVADNPAARAYGWQGRSAGALGERFLVPAPTRAQWEARLAWPATRARAFDGLRALRDTHLEYLDAVEIHAAAIGPQAPAA